MPLSEVVRKGGTRLGTNLARGQQLLPTPEFSPHEWESQPQEHDECFNGCDEMVASYFNGSRFLPEVLNFVLALLSSQV